MKLAARAFLKFVIGLILVGGLLFGTAGTVFFPRAWLFIVLLFVPILILGIVLLLRSPALLEKRLNGREKEGAQRGVVAAAALLFVLGFAVAGLDFRFGWSSVPRWVTTVASVILLVSYGLYAEVLRENAYLSRTVEVQEGQTVIDTGLYGIVRHPMYAVTLWLFLAIPLVLGSWWAFLCFLPYIPVIVIRILNEESVLSAELAGYDDYRKRVRFRLIPFVW
jgi:protein-S-isoprenylcysteine O-methyltransferase Ste14